MREHFFLAISAILPWALLSFSGLGDRLTTQGRAVLRIVSLLRGGSFNESRSFRLVIKYSNLIIVNSVYVLLLLTVICVHFVFVVCLDLVSVDLLFSALGMVELLLTALILSFAKALIEK